MLTEKYPQKVLSMYLAELCRSAVTNVKDNR